MGSQEEGRPAVDAGMTAPSQDPPLRIVGKPHPDTEVSTSQFREPGYHVYLTLSRPITPSEGFALRDQKVPGVRAYGSTLEVSNTSLEEISARKDELQGIVRKMEVEGQRRVEALERHRAETTRASEEEAARRLALAAEINFD
jgi:hypothetical protein